MPITKAKKQELFAQYRDDIANASNVVAVQQESLGVGDFNALRAQVRDAGGHLRVVKKTLFCRAIADVGYAEVAKTDLPWSVVVVFGGEEPFAPLKVISNHKKAFAKQKDAQQALTFVGWWFDDGQWSDAEYVNTLASMPSREELLSKVAWLLNYPIQSFAMAIDQVAKNGGNGATDEATPVQTEAAVQSDEKPADEPAETTEPTESASDQPQEKETTE